MRWGVVGARKLDRTGWLRQARDFYQHATADAAIRQAFADNGVDLEGAQLAITDVLLLEGELKRERGEARLAQQARQAAFVELDAWLRVFVAVARKAFGRSRGLLEQLGR